MNNFKVLAAVRQVNAHGIISQQEFEVEAILNASRDDILLAWLDKYNNEWDLFHIVSFEQKI